MAAASTKTTGANMTALLDEKRKLKAQQEALDKKMEDEQDNAMSVLLASLVDFNAAFDTKYRITDAKPRASKGPAVCSNCGEPGHRKNTCKKPSKQVNATAHVEA